MDQDTSTADRSDNLETDCSSRVEEKLFDMSNQMCSISNTIKCLNDTLQKRMDSLESKMHTVCGEVSEMRNPDPEINFNWNRNVQNNCTVPSQFQSLPNLQVTRNLNTNQFTNPSTSEIVHTNSSFSLKMKPQTYDGSNDIGEYLTQFNLISEINNWSYQAKSLYLASSLSGNARSLLSELTEIQKRDFDSLVEILRTKFGTRNKAEIFRAQLKSMTRGKNQSISDLTQHIKKIT